MRRGSAALYDDASGLLDRLLLRLIATFQEATAASMNLPGRPARPDLDPGARLRARPVRPVARATRRLPAHLGARDALLRRSASGCEAIAAASGWNEALYRTWYLTGAVWTAGWLGLGTAFLLGRTRFGYSFALVPVPGRPVHVPAPQQARVRRAPARCRSSTSSSPAILALAVAVETYFQNDRWPMLAAAAVIGATILSHRPDGDDDPAGARATRSIRRPAPRSATLFPPHAPAADAVHEHHRRASR